tara:strand:- start:960 stop:1340 length:381 start_codon:yes stop_codon:yes gene_type:complete
MLYSFINNNSFEERYKESNRIRAKYPDRIPVIIEKDYRCKHLSDIDKKKYLVPGDLTIAQLLFVIRKRIKLNSQSAIYLFINSSVIPSTVTCINNLYNCYKNDDGFLYITYSGENTFGLTTITLFY